MTASLRLVAFGLLCCVTTLMQAAEPALTLDVWPGKAPGENGVIGDEKVLESKPGEKTIVRVTNVTHPTLAVYRPAKDKDTGAAVVIFPGGGYNILAWDLEGTEVAEWLNSIGVTGIVLKYRVPRRPDTPQGKAPVQPLMDAQRAVGLIRSKATEWGIDPERIGVLGFSAGGHLAANLSTHYDRRAYEPLDDADRVSCRPNFAVLIYSGGMIDKQTRELLPELQPTKDTPPMFFAHAGDDRVEVENSVEMYLALRKAGVPGELHVYSQGGHGFGLRPSESASSTWPARCEAWLTAGEWLKK